MVVAAGSRRKGTASPAKAVVTILEDTAACGVLGATVVFITNCLGFYRGWRGWTGVWRVWTRLDGVRSHLCNSTLAARGVDIALHPDVPVLSPVWSPRVPHYPVIYAVFCTVTNSNNTMVEVGSTLSSENTLERNKGKTQLSSNKRSKNNVEIVCIACWRSSQSWLRPPIKYAQKLEKRPSLKRALLMAWALNANYLNFGDMNLFSEHKTLHKAE